MNIVERTRTPISKTESAQRFVHAWNLRTGELPTLQTARALLALHAIETANGEKAWNYSPGNVIATAAWSGNAWRPPWFDIGPDSSPRDVRLHEAMLKGEAPSAFRAFGSWDLGFDDWIRTLRATFPEVVCAAGTGDAAALQVALSRKYSTDYARDPSGVQASFEAQMQSFDPLLVELPDRPLVDSERPAGPGDGSESLRWACSLLLAASGSLDAPATLRIGDQGPDVAWVQSLLRIRSDQTFGPKTDEAVRHMQQLAGLVADGIVGPKTWALFASLSSRENR